MFQSAAISAMLGTVRLQNFQKKEQMVAFTNNFKSVSIVGVAIGIFLAVQHFKATNVQL